MKPSPAHKIVCYIKGHTPSLRCMHMSLGQPQQTGVSTCVHVNSFGKRCVCRGCSSLALHTRHHLVMPQHLQQRNMLPAGATSV